MKQVIFVFLAASLVLGVVACGNNPYPEAKEYSDTDPARRPVSFPALGLTFPAVMEFTEGQEGVYDFRASVPKGKPVVTIEGMPAGLIFDAEKGRISWTPSFTAGNQPEHPEADSRVYPIKVTLYDSEDPATVVSRNTSILVRDVRRPLLVWSQDTGELTEGAQFSQFLLVASEDSPEGDIRVYSNDLPRGALIEKDSSNPLKYWVRYTPSFQDVTNADNYDSQGFFKEINFNLHALAPGRRAGQKVVRWKIRDQRKSVQALGPAEVVSSGDVVFTVGGIDLNGEAPPMISMIRGPEMGRVETNLVTTPGERNLKMMNVRWYNIPNSAFNRIHEMKFSICNYSGANRQDACMEHTVRVNLTASNHRAPTMDRANWALGEVKELLLEDSLKVELPVRDGDTGQMLSDVAVELSSANCEVSWAAGELNVKGLALGYCQFNLVATSAFGLVQKESMILKVLPRPAAPGSSR